MSSSISSGIPPTFAPTTGVPLASLSITVNGHCRSVAPVNSHYAIHANTEIRRQISSHKIDENFCLAVRWLIASTDINHIIIRRISLCFCECVRPAWVFCYMLSQCRRTLSCSISPSAAICVMSFSPWRCIFGLFWIFGCYFGFNIINWNTIENNYELLN